MRWVAIALLALAAALIIAGCRGFHNDVLLTGV